MTNTNPPNRCRLVLIAPENAASDAFVSTLQAALAGGDVASLILPPYAMDDASFQKLAEAIVPAAQAAGVAVVLAGDTRIATRVGADGVHVEANRAGLDDVIDRLQAKMAVGAGGAKTRDDALELGEARPDYVFFGRFGYDNKPEAHPRNLTLGAWWAEVIEIPCIVMGGASLDSVADVARTGVEFVALSRAIFDDPDPKQAIARANALLDEHAPRFGEAA